jgi:DNA-binding NarL/FixJ family response regulator
VRSPDSFEGATRTAGRSDRGIGHVRISLLGSFRVSIGSRTIGEDQWRLRKAAALVKLLALAPNHRLHCEQVMYLLWPHLGPEAAANNLRRTLHSARRTFETDPESAARYLGRRGGQLMLCPEASLWVDVDAFEEAAATARRTREPAAYWIALDAYSGDLLLEDRYEEWAETRREQLQQTYLALLAEVAALHEERGEFGPRIEAVRRISLEKQAHGGSQAGTRRSYSPVEEALDSSTTSVRARSSPDEPKSRLSRREQEVAVLVACGLTNRQIAEKLGISDRTVDAHLRKIFAKLGLHSRVQLATWASEHGLLRENTS